MLPRRSKQPFFRGGIVAGQLAGVACLMMVTSVGCASIGSKPPPMAQSCIEWTQRSDEERFSIVGAALEQQIGGPASSRLASCLWLVSEQIAHQSAASCEERGGEFDAAMGRAIESAVHYCEGR